MAATKLWVDRALYGSGYPHRKDSRTGHYTAALHYLSVDDPAKIMGGNIARLMSVRSRGSAGATVI